MTKPATQRGTMRELFRRYKGKERETVDAYARAENNGEVKRNSDVLKIPAIEYAKRLLSDGKRKRWIYK